MEVKRAVSPLALLSQTSALTDSINGASILELMIKMMDMRSLASSSWTSMLMSRWPFSMTNSLSILFAIPGKSRRQRTS